MDIDRISYIFGSFSRRRQSHETSSAKRRSIESTNKKIFHDRSKSTPHQQSKKTISVSPRAKSVFELGFDEGKFKCPLCKGSFVEPRVLPCLHTFCLKCIEDLESRDSNAWYENGGPEGKQKFLVISVTWNFNFENRFIVNICKKISRVYVDWKEKYIMKIPTPGLVEVKPIEAI